ncbi:MAG: MDR family MFS transporter [Acidobacteriota bacterium]
MELSRERRMLVTTGILMGMLLAAMESMIVTTAMPSVVASLGGLVKYSWVFSLYLLTSTVSMPIWGKLSDLYGRRLCYQLGVLIFIIGSALCGVSQSMTQLIIFRALQGLGAGAVVPLGLTIIGEVFTIEERVRMQGLFSSVWGFASITGPLIGGFITDHFSWRWIFYINIPFGLLAVIIMWIGLAGPAQRQSRPAIDVAGAVSLSAAISLLILSCLRGKEGLSLPLSIIALCGSILCIWIFIRVEQRAAEPILPLELFRERIFFVGMLANLLTGCTIFGSIPFITLYAQGVLGTSATKAGTILMPLMLGWVCCSVLGGRLLIRIEYRIVTLAGTLLLVLGLIIMTVATNGTDRQQIYIGDALMGMGMGLTAISLLIAVQKNMRNQLGVATAATLFFRNIGGVVGAAIMGTIVSTSLSHIIATIPTTDSAVSVDLARMATDINIAFDPIARTALHPQALSYFRGALAGGIHNAFFFALIVGLGALASVWKVPPGRAIEKPAAEPSLNRSQAAN